MRFIQRLTSVIGLCSVTFLSQAQQLPDAPKDLYGSGLKFNFDEKGDKYLRLIFLNQIWLRTNANNPNTVVNNEVSERTTDIGLRRSRMIAYAQLSDRFLILTHFGVNNQSFSSGGAHGSNGTGGYGLGKKPGIFMHDAYVEYTLIPDFDIQQQHKNKFSLYLGAGLQPWNGVSRMTSASTLNILTLDAPIFNWATIDQADQFGRQLGVYAKGNWGKWSYNFNLSKPFATNLTPTIDPIRGQVAVDHNGDSKMAIQGYVDYQFLDKEANLLPYRVGSYLGKKRVFNIGAGFYHQKDGTKSMAINGAISKHPINLFSADVYADLPLGAGLKQASLNFYSAFYSYHFGPNYYRNMGIMNTATGLDPHAHPLTNSISGAGNSRLMLGTGQLAYGQIGYMLPKFSRDQRYRLMPYIAYSYKNLEAVDEASHSYDIGTNLLLNGHNAKITAQYSRRPLYFQNGQSYTIGDHKGEFTIQFHVFL